MVAQTNVLISGCSAGIGLVTTVELLDRGHTVMATMREPEGRNASKADELRERAGRGLGTLHVFELDVTDDGSVTSAVRAALEAVGSIDALINNAGYGGFGYLEGFTSTQIGAIFDTNVAGMHRLNRAVLPGMRERGSSLLVHLSSAMGRTIIPFAAPYTATKFAIEGLAESLHYELAGTGVDVAIVQPGAFATSFQDNVQEPADTERVASYGRLADRSAAFWNSYSEQIGFSECVPDPKLVADVIVRLGESPGGSRPLRTVIDPLTDGAGAPEINQTCERIQAEFLRSFGVDDLHRSLG